MVQQLVNTLGLSKIIATEIEVCVLSETVSEM